MTILLLVVMATNVFASEKVVTVSTMKGYAPFIFTENDRFVQERVSKSKHAKYVRGFSWEVFEQSMLAKGYRIIITVKPWARALSDLEEYKVDLLIPAIKNTER